MGFFYVIEIYFIDKVENKDLVVILKLILIFF